MATTENIKIENIDDIDEVEKIFKLANERNRQQNADAQRIKDDVDRKNREDLEQQRRDAEAKQAINARKMRKIKACGMLACITVIAAFGTFFGVIYCAMLAFDMSSAVLTMLAAITGAAITLVYRAIYAYLKKEIYSTK